MALSPLQQFLSRAVAREIPQARFESFFQLNQVKTGHVLKQIDRNYFLIQIGPFRLLSKSELPLQPGQRIWVRVAGLNPGLHLQLLPAEKKPVGGIRGFPPIEAQVTEEFAQTVVFYLSDATESRKPSLRVSYHPSAKNQQRRPIKQITLFIDFEGIGRTEVHLQAASRGLRIQIASPNLRWVHQLKQSQQALQTRLADKNGVPSPLIQIVHRGF